MNDVDDASTEPKHGLLTSLRRLVTTLIAIVGTRLEILITEVEQEKIRLGRILILGATVMFCMIMALIFLSLLVLMVFWNEHRIAALAGITIVYILLAVIAAWRLRSNVKRKSRLFSISLGELRKDYRELET